MHFVTFHIDGTEWTGWTEVLAGSAADAIGFVDGWDIYASGVVLVERNHFDGSRWTMAFTVSAIHTVRHRNTVLLDPHGMTDLCRTFVFHRDRSDGTSRTHFRALRAFRSAIATLVARSGLHERQQIRGRTEHAIRTSRHTQLASRAVLCHVLSRERTRRRDRCVALGSNLVLNHSQSSIYIAFALCQCRCGGCHCCRHEERTARTIHFCLR